jgi:PHD/YefM family antitoxin component YafN of YafNO toxin-antitoxin module
MTEMDVVNYSEMRKGLASHLKKCAKYGKRFKIVRNGKAEGVLVSTADWEQILETLSILTNPHLMEQLIESEKDIRKGRVQPLDEAFKELLGEG